jgi:hypothetical protein
VQAEAGSKKQERSPALETYEQQTGQQALQAGGRGGARGGVSVRELDQAVGSPA